MTHWLRSFLGGGAHSDAENNAEIQVGSDGRFFVSPNDVVTDATFQSQAAVSARVIRKQALKDSVPSD